MGPSKFRANEVSYFYLYNPKFYDPGAVVRHYHPALDPIKRRKDEEPTPEEHTEELKKIAEDFQEIAKKNDEIRETILTGPRLDLIKLYEDVLRKEMEIAKLFLQMEEEELAVILMLLEK